MTGVTPQELTKLKFKFYGALVCDQKLSGLELRVDRAGRPPPVLEQVVVQLAGAPGQIEGGEGAQRHAPVASGEAVGDAGGARQERGANQQRERHRHVTILSSGPPRSNPAVDAGSRRP